MRNTSVRSQIRRAVVLASLALAASSCSRSLPTAPASIEAVTPRGISDPFATQGLENQVVVTFASGVNPASIAAEYGSVVVTSEGGEQMAALRPVTGQTAAALMAQLLVDGRIVTAEPNQWIEPAEARQQSFAFDDGAGSGSTYAEQPAAQTLGITQAHDVATGRGVKVAIIDTGADLMHPKLRHSIVGGWDFVNNDPIAAEQKDFQDNDRDGSIDEAYGHGTHVAGIVHLVAPDAQLLIVRVLDSDGRGDIVNVTAGVRWAIENGAKVINLSLGAVRNTEALQHVMADAESLGITVVSSAGNWGMNILDYPAFSSHALGVAAVDANDNVAPFSSYDGKVAISAPGVGIRSTYPGGGYRLWTGTSMSAPFVAGAAALLVEKHPNWIMDEVQSRLGGTADRVRGPNRVDFGDGALNIAAALAPDFALTPETGGNETIRPR